MSMSTISVIIPAYNSAKTLTRAIKSVKDADEIIVVDDCSTDETKAVLEKALIKFQNLIYYRLDENSGPDVARKKGILISTGNWITFLDADDTLSRNAFCKAKKLINDSPTVDIIQMQMNWALTPFRMPFPIKNKYQTEHALEACLYDDTLFPIHCCGKIYRRELIDDSKDIDCNVRWGEDRLFNLPIMAQSPMIIVDKSMKYNYTFHRKGLSQRRSISSDVEEVARLKIEWCKENGLEQHVPLIERECSILLDYVEHKTVK